MKRRSRLLAVLGIAALSLTLVACGNNQAASEPEKEADTAAGATKEVSYTPASELKDRYDVVIVGAGGAGMAAALQAQEAGMNPVILEKMPVAGGNTLKSSGGMNASETKFQEKASIKDSNQLFLMIP